MARPEKAAAVAEITERFTDSEAAILTEYRGLKVAEIAEVRRSLREAEAEYKVLKNTLTRIAARNAGIDGDEFEAMLVGPTAIVFAHSDVAAAAKALDEASKSYPVLAVKGGIMQGRIFDAAQAKELAKLEPRDVQLAKIAGLFNQPAQRLANVFAALLRDFGSMLAQVVQRKESGELPSGAAAETPPDAAPGAPVEVPGEPEEAPDEHEEPADEPGPGSPEEQPSEEAPPVATAEPAEVPEATEQAEAAPESQEAANEEVTSATREGKE